MDLFAWAEQHDCTAVAPPAQNPCTRPADELPHDFLHIVKILEHHVGSRSAITAADLAKAAGVRPDGSRESRRSHVRHLLRVHFLDLPWPICADTAGFYRPATADELSHYHANLLSRLREIALRIKALKTVSKTAGWQHIGRCRWLHSVGAHSPDTPPRTPHCARS